MIHLSKAQAARVVDSLGDTLSMYDTLLNEWGQDAIDPDDDPDGERAELIEEHEQVCLLRANVIAQIGNTKTPAWECADEGCAWLNPIESTLCNQCGQERKA